MTGADRNDGRAAWNCLMPRDVDGWPSAWDGALRTVDMMGMDSEANEAALRTATGAWKAMLGKERIAAEAASDYVDGQRAG